MGGKKSHQVPQVPRTAKTPVPREGDLKGRTHLESAFSTSRQVENALRAWQKKERGLGNRDSDDGGEFRGRWIGTHMA